MDGARIVDLKSAKGTPRARAGRRPGDAAATALAPAAGDLRVPDRVMNRLVAEARPRPGASGTKTAPAPGGRGDRRARRAAGARGAAGRRRRFLSSLLPGRRRPRLRLVEPGARPLHPAGTLADEAR